MGSQDGLRLKRANKLSKDRLISSLWFIDLRMKRISQARSDRPNWIKTRKIGKNTTDQGAICLFQGIFPCNWIKMDFPWLSPYSTTAERDNNKEDSHWSKRRKRPEMVKLRLEWGNRLVSFSSLPILNHCGSVGFCLSFVWIGFFKSGRFEEGYRIKSRRSATA